MARGSAWARLRTSLPSTSTSATAAAAAGGHGTCGCSSRRATQAAAAAAANTAARTCLAAGSCGCRRGPAVSGATAAIRFSSVRALLVSTLPHTGATRQLALAACRALQVRCTQHGQRCPDHGTVGDRSFGRTGGHREGMTATCQQLHVSHARLCHHFMLRNSLCGCPALLLQPCSRHRTACHRHVFPCSLPLNCCNRASLLYSFPHHPVTRVSALSVRHAHGQKHSMCVPGSDGL